MASTSQTYSSSPNEIVTINMGATFIRTMIVDDAPEFAKTVAGVLGRHQWITVVRTVANGLEALQAAIVDVPDLIVMDVNMPVMNGLEATMRIKEQLPQTKILIVSADDGEDIALAALDCGADGFIPKSKIAEERDWHIERLFGDRITALLSARSRAQPQDKDLRREFTNS